MWLLNVMIVMFIRYGLQKIVKELNQNEPKQEFFKRGYQIPHK